MQILTIPEIKGNFYGGLPYSLSLQLNYSDAPSTLTIQTVSENGVYQKPNLNNGWTNKVTIKIGDFNFQGFLVKWKQNKNTSQKTFELTYQDCSSILNKTWIGLHKRHGINPYAKASYGPVLGIGHQDFPDYNSNNIIIVGRELHPCDINNDGVINGIDASYQIDFCDPCPNCPPNKYQYRCTAENDLKIFRVGYTFSELLQRIGVPVPSRVAEATTYFREYSGKLRDVLNQWCGDFGFNFYWDYSAATIREGVKLVDRTVPISIDFTPGDCEVTELYNGESIENAFAQGTISYYEREGASKTYSCSDDAYYNLNCLRVRDLLNPTNYPDFDASIRWRELGIGLSYYSSALRDCMYWFNYYGIQNAAKAKEKIWTESNNTIINYNQSQTKLLRELGNMKILKVIDYNDANFKACKELLGDAIKPFDKRSKNDLNRPDDNPSYYFFVAEQNEEVATQIFNWESEVAKSFLGKYWVRVGTPVTCAGCGTNPRYSQINVEAPDGSAGWFPKGNQTAYPPFTNFNHQEGSNIDSFIQDSNSDEAATTSPTDLGGVTLDIETSKSFILLERDAKWFPNNGNLPSYQGTLEYYQTLIFNKVDVGTKGQPSLLTRLYPGALENPNISLFVVQEINQPNLPVTISEVKNFLEPSKMQSLYANNNDTPVCVANRGDNEGQTLIGTYGLKDSTCAWVTFDGFSFMMPVQAVELIGAGDNNPFDDTSDTFSGYKIRVNQSFDVPVCIPKIQTILASIPNEPNVGNFDINFVNISDDDIKIFGANSCTPSEEELQRIHETKGIQTSISNSSPEKILEYRIIGTPTNIPLINQGLDGLSVEVNDGGVFTTYSLSDKLREPPKAELILDQATRRYPTINNYPFSRSFNTPRGL